MHLRRLFALLLVAGCQPAAPQQQASRIEIRKFGETSLDISVEKSGNGSFEKSDLVAPYFTRGTFHISEQQFRALEVRLAEFRAKAAPLTDATRKAVAEARCPAGVPNVTDQGGISIVWTGPDLNAFYLADFGCDPNRNATRNAKLRSVVSSLMATART